MLIDFSTPDASERAENPDSSVSVRDQSLNGCRAREEITVSQSVVLAGCERRGLLIRARVKQRRVRLGEPDRTLDHEGCSQNLIIPSVPVGAESLVC